MNTREFLLALNGLGVKSIPIVGAYIGEVLEREFNTAMQAEDAIAVARQLKMLESGRTRDSSTLSSLIGSLTPSDYSRVEFIGPLEELKYAVDHPNDPKPEVASRIQAIADRFDTVEELAAWCEVEIRSIDVRLSRLERRVDHLETFVNSMKPREFNDAFDSELKNYIPNGFRGKVEIMSTMNDAEAFNFAHQILSSLKNRNIDVEGVSQAGFTRPIVGQHIEKTDNGFRLIIGSRT